MANNRMPRKGGPRGFAGGQKVDGKAFARLMRMLFHDYPGKLTAVVICITLNAVIGITPTIFVKTITSYIETGLTTGWDAILPKMIQSVVLMVALYAVSVACAATYTQLMAHVTQGFLHNIRTRMFSRMQTLPIRYFDQNTRGDIMSYYTNDTDTLRQLISQSLPQLFSSGLMCIGLIFIMLYYSMPLMLIVVLGIFAMTRVTKSIGGKSATFFVRQQKSLAKAEGYIEETMNGQKVVQVFCHEQAAEADFDKLNDQLFQDARNANRFANIFMPIMNNIGNILYTLTAFVGGLLVCSGGSVPNVSFENLLHTGSMLGVLSIPVIASFLGMTKQFTGNISRVSDQINSVVMAIAGAGRIFELLDEQPEIDDGDVLLDGEVITDPSVDPVTVRRRLAMVFQAYNLLPQFNAWENVAVPLEIRGILLEERRKQALEALEMVGLLDHAEHRPTEMSGGQQQRISIARAIITRPDIVFADEPTGNLDTRTGTEIMNLLTDLFRRWGTTFLLVSHDDEMHRYTDREIRLQDGKIDRIY